jgi:hypothetical protein
MSTVESSVPSPDPGWYVEDLVSTLVIGAGGARLHERWSVVAELPLDELLLELNLDGVPHPQHADLVDAVGAELVPDAWPAGVSGRPVVGVRLPKPLGPWETHTFGLIICPPGTSTGPTRHVVVPGGPVLRLELRVHFEVPAAPAAVTRLEAGVAGPGTPVDRAGDVAAVFSDLLPGLPYGVTW